jgi:hypothetical protein
MARPWSNGADRDKESRVTGRWHEVLRTAKQPRSIAKLTGYHRQLSGSIVYNTIFSPVGSIRASNGSCLALLGDYLILLKLFTSSITTSGKEDRLACKQRGRGPININVTNTTTTSWATASRLNYDIVQLMAETHIVFSGSKSHMPRCGPTGRLSRQFCFGPTAIAPMCLVGD